MCIHASQLFFLSSCFLFYPTVFSPCQYLLAFIYLFWSPCLHLFGFSFLRLLTVCDNTSFVFLVSRTLSCFATECWDDPVSMFCWIKKGSRTLSDASLGCFSPLINWTQEQWLSSQSVEILTRHCGSSNSGNSQCYSKSKSWKFYRTVKENVRCTQRCKRVWLAVREDQAADVCPSCLSQ